MKAKGKDFFPTLDLPKPAPLVTDAPRCQWPGCSAWALYGFREPGWANVRKPVERTFCAPHARQHEAGEP